MEKLTVLTSIYYKVVKSFVESIPGGLADGKVKSDFDPEALTKGIKVEMEHTDSKDMATEIAMDHLTEDENYYDKLEIIES